MKDLLIGMGIGFLVGAVVVRTSKPFAEKIEQGVEKGKEIFTDIKDEVKTQNQNTQEIHFNQQK